MNKPVKITLEVLLLALACYVGFRAVSNVKGTIDFGAEREVREAVAIQRLSDIRELEKAYYNRYGVYQDTFAVLKDFYLNQSIITMYENGSLTDTVATEMTDKIKLEILKKYERQKVKFAKHEIERKNDSLNMSLYRDYYLPYQQAVEALKDTTLTKEQKEAFEKQLADYKKYENVQFKVPIPQPVHTQLFQGRKDFEIDSLEFIPFSGGKKISYWTYVEDDETGSSVPVYEVKIPYEDLLTGLDENEIRSWCKERLKFDHDLPKKPHEDNFVKNGRVLKRENGLLGTVIEVVNDTTRIDEKHFSVALRSIRVRFDDKEEVEYGLADVKKVTTDTLHCFDQRTGLQIGGDYEFNNGNGNWK